MASGEQPIADTTQGFDKQANATTDPFAAQRDGGANPFENGGTAANREAVGSNGAEQEGTGAQGDEWDASKTLPSKFQQRKGSVFATPSSRDGHVGKNADRDAKYHEKLVERGWGKKDKDRRGSKSSN